MIAIAVAAVSFLVMEPIAALTHRAVMHGRGRRWHTSHHRSARGERLASPRGAEANDLYPLCFAVVTTTAMAVGAWWPPARALLWVGAGVTAYGASYLLVHDVCIHGRLGPPRRQGRYLRWVADAHGVHHRTGGAPYGFLLPVVPGRRGAGDADEAMTVTSLRAVDTRARPVKTS